MLGDISEGDIERGCEYKEGAWKGWRGGGGGLIDEGQGEEELAARKMKTQLWGHTRWSRDREGKDHGVGEEAPQVWSRRTKGRAPANLRKTQLSGSTGEKSKRMRRREPQESRREAQKPQGQKGKFLRRRRLRGRETESPNVKGGRERRSNKEMPEEEAAERPRNRKSEREGRTRETGQ